MSFDGIPEVDLNSFVRELKYRAMFELGVAKSIENLISENEMLKQRYFLLSERVDKLDKEAIRRDIKVFESGKFDQPIEDAGPTRGSWRYNPKTYEVEKIEGNLLDG